MWLRFSRGWVLTAALTIGVASSTLVFTPHVHADQPKLDATRARELFRDALALMAAGDYASALGKLQEVASFKTTPQVSFNLGVCSEKLGKFVVALGHYRLAQADADADPALAKVAKEASRAIAALDPKIPTLTVRRGAGAENAVITVDGKDVIAADVGSPMLLDPGLHTVEARADGYQPFKKQMRLDTSEKAAVDIALALAVGVVVPVASASVPKPVASVPAVASVSPQPSATATPSAEPPVAPPTPTSNGLRTLGWVSLGVGVVGGITSAIFFAKRSSVLSDLDGMCGSDKQSCPDSARVKMDEGKSATLIGNVGLAVGAVGIVTGIILLAAGGGGSSNSEKPSDSMPAARIRLLPSSPGAWAGATLDARF
jgi:hypothetical protein